MYGLTFQASKIVTLPSIYVLYLFIPSPPKDKGNIIVIASVYLSVC